MSAIIHFTKMHGLGNDFVIIDAITQAIILTPAQIRALADRHRGIGCDQVLLVEHSTDPAIDFFYRIFNADGSEVGQCGNGARCLAKFVTEKALTSKKKIRVKTKTAVLELETLPDAQISVTMGIPQNLRQVSINNLTGIALEIGNPHVVFFYEDVCMLAAQQERDKLIATQGNIFSPGKFYDAFIYNLGELCNQDPLFPNGVNVGFMKIIDHQYLQLRVYERGVGETDACGSGACAAAIAGIYQHLLDQKVNVELPGGKLAIRWQGAHTPVMMTGPATTVFSGEILIQ